MVCTANGLLEWRDFPKGLRVLLLDGDNSSAAQIRSKLEAMDYIVSTFCDENEALSAISNEPESFHIAIVEVSSSNSDGRFKFLEVAKHLPTIMTSKLQCLATMMKCIALGAVEFLLEPLSDDKLRNIWQHVVHKAFSAEGKGLPETLKPVKESVVSMLQLEVDNGEPKSNILVKSENETAVGSDRYPAPLTPQLKQGVRLVDDGDCQDQTNSSEEKEGGDQDGESKSVDTTCGSAMANTAAQARPPEILDRTVTKEENESPYGCRSESNMSCPRNKDSLNDSGADAGNPVKASGIHHSCANKANRKKMKVDWTPELHKKFVQAVEQLGVGKAIPSRILELMKVEGLTRHNVASHLQKYRMQRRHILPREEDRRWPHPRDPSQRNYYPHKPVMAFPPYYSNPTFPAAQVSSAWGPPGSYLTGLQTWSPTFYSPWQPAQNWHWKPYQEMNADAWGCPVMPPQPHGSCLSFPQNVAGFVGANTGDGRGIPQSSFDLHPAEEVIDKVVKEAISKPWLPLPIGLKPPSTDSVLTELSKQGLSPFPPRSINGSRPR
ncbi:two-component response regulator-like APRR2 [Diospyros lotus]|uniref:two-component response regulator-like APRR2 n=1 Tax=Diospyros lotus TaxID=55363 RepID=UPI00224EE123|nr:two-component response regulator-like APRR2 [Diospyros lotus]XP_052170971.1 two-component response regulator-like APRR2 [Diospyros lotus]XP_052170972.1 two-component response regulator-like APRR2 [Diospyros lotus]